MLSRRLFVERLSSFPPIPFVAGGLLLVSASLFWPRLSVLHGTMGPDGIDFMQGLLAGVGIACEIMGLAILSGQRHKSSSK